MISKDLYLLLCAIPKYPDKIQYYDLLNKNAINPTLAYKLLQEEKKENHRYFSCSAIALQNSYFSLIENGIVAIEQYELNQRLMEQNEKSNELAKKSFCISVIAMVAAIASAIAAVVSLIKMFC